MHAALGGHAVDDVERVVVVEGADTANAHGGGAAGRTLSADVHTRHTALQRFDGVVLVLLGDFVDVNGSDGAGHVDLALSGVTHGHHFVQKQSVLLEADSHTVGGSNGDSLETNIRNGEFFAGGDRDGEVAIVVGGDALGGGGGHHGCTDQRLIVGGRQHCAIHGDVLGLSGDGCHKQYQGA